MRGTLLGTSDRLAPESNEYPFIRWKSLVKKCDVDEKGNVSISLGDELTAELGIGIQFKPSTYGVWRQD